MLHFFVFFNTVKLLHPHNSSEVRSFWVIYQSGSVVVRRQAYLYGFETITTIKTEYRNVHHLHFAHYHWFIHLGKKRTYICRDDFFFKKKKDLPDSLQRNSSFLGVKMVGQLQSHFVISKCLRVRKSTWVFATYFWDFSNSDLFFSACLIEVLLLNEIYLIHLVKTIQLIQ